VIRRRRLPSHLERPAAAFERVLAVVEPAKAELTEVVPTTRRPGRPLREAAATFAASLDRAAALMPAWRHPELGSVWEACRAGIEESGRRCEALLRADREPDGFEGLIWTVGHLLDPLEPFVEAARRLDDLRVRTR
jgi:hypothetical protein